MKARWKRSSSYLEFFKIIRIAYRVATASPERGGGCAEGADGGGSEELAID